MKRKRARGQTAACSAPAREPPKLHLRQAEDLPEEKRIYRYWVELPDLRDGSGRDLALAVITWTHIRRKKGEPQRPIEQVLRLQDYSAVIEATDIDDLAAQLRERYPYLSLTAATRLPK